MKLYNWLFLLLLVPAIWSFNTLHHSVNIHGTIIGMNQDQVKAGKNGSRDRFQVAVKYSNRHSDTIEVPFHYYLEAKVGDTITHPVKTLNPKYEGLFVIGGAILFSFSLILGVVPFLWEIFMIIKRFKSKYPESY